MKPKQSKIKIFFITIILLLFFLINAILVSNGYTNKAYEILQDVFVIFVSAALCVYNIKFVLKDKKSYLLHLIIANIFWIIAVIHILRLFLGGLPC